MTVQRIYQDIESQHISKLIKQLARPVETKKPFDVIIALREGSSCKLIFVKLVKSAYISPCTAITR